MLSLTLRHPWPFAIRSLGKDIENRAWHPGRRLPVGSWLAIHGGRMPTGDGLGDVLREGRDLCARFRDQLALGPGEDVTLRDAIVEGVAAVCRFGGVVASSPSPWFEGPCGWVLAGTVALPEPVPCKGAQGLWPLPDDVLEKVREQYRLARERMVPA